MNSIEKFNNRILEISQEAYDAGFKDFKKNEKNETEELEMLSPCFLPDALSPENCNLLIIGLNPSYSYANWKKTIKNHQRNGTKSADFITSINCNTDSDLDNYIAFKNFNLYKKKEFHELDKIASAEDYGVDYFSKMHTLAKHLFGEKGKNRMKHIDLYYYRKTNQEDIKKFEKSHFDFFREQRELSKEVIKWLNPEIILVANAYACEIFREIFLPIIPIKLDMEIQPKKGAEFIENYILPISGKIQNKKIKQEKPFKLNAFQKKEIVSRVFFDNFFNKNNGAYELNFKGNQHKKTKVFFSGMLSGQRALDLGSFERLKWHMKAALNGKVMTA